MDRRRISSGAPWEERFGYSRAIRVGNRVLVAGTVGIDAHGAPAGEDAFVQTRRALEIIEHALVEAGASIGDVVRTRMYVCDVARNGDDVGRAHGEVFGAIRPASTMVEVPALLRPGLLVEIEAEAVMAVRPKSDG